MEIWPAQDIMLATSRIQLCSFPPKGVSYGRIPIPGLGLYILCMANGCSHGTVYVSEEMVLSLLYSGSFTRKKVFHIVFLLLQI
jgi:hypothetical protein